MSADRTNVHGAYLSEVVRESISFDYEKTSKLIDRAVSVSVSPGEYWLLRLIFDLTVGNSKEWELIKSRHFKESGFCRENREWYRGCIKMSATTRSKHLKTLIEFGYVRIRKTKKGLEYSLAIYLLEPV